MEIENIIDINQIDYINKKLNVKCALGGSRALALVGINLHRPITMRSDYDFSVKHVSFFRRKQHLRNPYRGDDGYGSTEDLSVEKESTHYYFYYTDKNNDVEFKNCLFIYPKVITTVYKNILIVDPEQIIYFKQKYADAGDAKHQRDLENLTRLRYNLNNL